MLLPDKPELPDKPYKLELPDKPHKLELPDKPQLPDKLHKLELPDDVLQIIHQFSRPITRPDWRTLHKLTEFKLHLQLTNASNRTNVYLTPDNDYLYILRVNRISLMFRSPHLLF